jgi:hypothetical protein
VPHRQRGVELRGASKRGGQQGIGGKIPSSQEDDKERELAPNGVESHRGHYFPFIATAMRWTSSGLFCAISWRSPLAWG